MPTLVTNEKVRRRSKQSKPGITKSLAREVSSSRTPLGLENHPALEAEAMFSVLQ